ncbi:hypothetical protein D9M71_753040 [compost metagenome]
MPAPARASWRRVSLLEARIVGAIARLSPRAWRRGQLFRLSGWVKPSRLWLRRSSTLFGVPRAAR